MSKNMTQHRVVPDVIKNVPPILLKVVWANGISTADGNELTPTQVKEQPANVQWEADSNAYYTLCMTDPDAPSRQDPKSREWHHWLVVNIPGNNIEQGEVLSEYIGSGPPKGTGLHRYVILVYKQPEKMKFPIEKKLATSGAGRGKFSIQKFAGKFNLGEPIAGNFFQAQWDDWVPKLYKTLGN